MGVTYCRLPGCFGSAVVYTEIIWPKDMGPGKIKDSRDRDGNSESDSIEVCIHPGESAGQWRRAYDLNENSAYPD